MRDDELDVLNKIVYDTLFSICSMVIIVMTFDSYKNIKYSHASNFTVNLGYTLQSSHQMEWRTWQIKEYKGESERATVRDKILPNYDRKSSVFQKTSVKFAPAIGMNVGKLSQPYIERPKERKNVGSPWSWYHRIENSTCNFRNENSKLSKHSKRI